MNALSLFSNIGIGESLLFKNNINIKVANEIIEKRVKIYREMYPKVNMISGDIRNNDTFNKIIESSLKFKCDFLIATPPCQGMSAAGKRQSGDIRNDLTTYVIDVIKLIKPKYILIENVPNFEKTTIKINNKDVNVFEYLKSELSDYKINSKVINCADYGIPQNRKRIFILISRMDVKEWGFNLVKKDIITVEDAIGHLPSIESGEHSDIKYHYAIEHNKNHVLWMKNTPTGKTAFDNIIHFPNINGRLIKAYRSSYRRIRWDKPSPTITTGSSFISSQNKVHPGRKKSDGTYSDARSLSPLEIMLLMGLKSSWGLPEWVSDNLLRKVIGEAVPPKIIYELTKDIKNVIK